MEYSIAMAIGRVAKSNTVTNVPTCCLSGAALYFRVTFTEEEDDEKDKENADLSDGEGEADDEDEAAQEEQQVHLAYFMGTFRQHRFYSFDSVTRRFEKLGFVKKLVPRQIVEKEKQQVLHLHGYISSPNMHKTLWVNRKSFWVN